MKKFLFALLIAGAMVGTVHAQASLFDRYDVNMTKWAQLPADMPWGGETSWVAADGKGQVAVMVRKPPYIRILTTDGKFVKAWGDEPLFKTAHSVYFDREGNMWGVDNGNSVIYEFDANGNIVKTMGKKGMPGDNTSQDLFNGPSTMFFAANGDIYVADGYVNSRVVQFNKDGKFIRIYGGVKGNGPGQLSLVHGVVVDSQGRVIISDSDNKRLAVFDKTGKFIENWPAPCRGGIAITPDDTIYVSDVNAGMVEVLKDGKMVDVIHVDGRPHGLGMDPTTMELYTSSSAPGAPSVTKISLKKPKPVVTSSAGAGN